MRILRSKYYLVRVDNENDNSVELVGGPFDRVREAQEHTQTAKTSDLDIWEGAMLLLKDLRVQDRRPNAISDSSET